MTVRDVSVDVFVYVMCIAFGIYSFFFFFLMIRRPPRSTLDRSSAASDVYKRQLMDRMPPIGSKVSIGGPVQSSNLYYLHTLGPHLDGSTEVVDGVHMGGDFDQLRSILSTDPKLARHVRFFVGYSGWTEGQLDKELAERAWLVANVDKKRIMHTGKKNIWAETLRDMGPEFAPLANFPDDPALN